MRQYRVRTNAFIRIFIPLIYITSFLYTDNRSHHNDYRKSTIVSIVGAVKFSFGRIDRMLKSNLDRRSQFLEIYRGGGSQPENDNGVSDTTSSRNESIELDNHEKDDILIEDDADILNVEISNVSNETITKNISDKIETTQTEGDVELPNEEEDNNSRSSSSESANEDSTITGSESVAMKHQVKKSNAVGDSDGDDDDDDDDDIDDDEDFIFDSNAEPNMLSDKQNSDDDAESLIRLLDTNADPFLIDENVDDGLVERVQVEVEYTVEEEDNDDDDRLLDNQATIDKKRNRRAGGVGVRSFGQRFTNRNRKSLRNTSNQSNKDLEAALKLEQYFAEVWQPYIYFPPPQTTTSDGGFWQYFRDHQTSIEMDGKLRLDRRTLYAGLLAELSIMSHFSSNSNKNTNRRKFLDPDTSQALQAAVALATQPMWRKSVERTNAIRLYDIDLESNRRISATTLSIQETITLGLVSEVFV
jgi:hypothetical protein